MEDEDGYERSCVWTARAIVERDLGQIDDARRHLNSAIGICRRASNEELAIRYSCLAIIEENAGNHKEAEHMKQSASDNWVLHFKMLR